MVDNRLALWVEKMSEYFCRGCRQKHSTIEQMRYCPVCGKKNPVKKDEELLEKLYAVIKKVRPEENSLNTANIVTYELGDLIKKLFYGSVYPERYKVCMIEAQIALSDLLTQCQIICKREGWNFNELTSLGLKRAYDRITEYLEDQTKIKKEEPDVT